MRKREKEVVVVSGLVLLSFVLMWLSYNPIFYYTHITANLIANYIIILVFIAGIGSIIGGKPKK